VILPNRRSARSMLSTAATALSLDQVQHDLFESLGVPFQGGGGGGGGTGLSTGGANGGAPAAAAAASSAQRPASMMYQQHRIGAISGVGAGVGGGAAAAAGALAAAAGVRHGHDHSHSVAGAALSAAGSHRSHVAKTVAYISAGAAVGAVFDASRWYPQQQQSQQQQQPGSRALTLQQQQQQLQNVEAALSGALTSATQQQQQQQRQQPAPAHVFRSHAQSIGGAGDSSASSTPLASSSLSSAPSARDVIDLPVSIKRALRLPPPPPDLGWMRSTTISTSPFYANHRDGGQRLRYWLLVV
jgi:hypothetical protein